MEANPFPECSILDAKFLDDVPQREVCKTCGRKRRYYCYNCYHYLHGLEAKMPTVQLPVQIDIIKHQQERDSKSTAAHAVLLAPEHVSLHIFPDVPNYDPKTDVLVFPTDTSMLVEEWASKQIKDVEKTENTNSNIPKGRVVFIDCTWNQIHPIINDHRIKDLPTISLHKYKTKFWRPNGNKLADDCLATIEAIYYFVKEYHEFFMASDYSGQYDNLLMLFKYQYLKIKEYHQGGDNLKAYKHKSTPEKGLTAIKRLKSEKTDS